MSRAVFSLVSHITTACCSLRGKKYDLHVSVGPVCTFILVRTGNSEIIMCRYNSGDAVLLILFFKDLHL